MTSAEEIAAELLRDPELRGEVVALFHAAMTTISEGVRHHDPARGAKLLVCTIEMLHAFWNDPNAVGMLADQARKERML